MKPIIIAGNGPSLKEIDYKRLPKEYDVFRCNQFFFEDKYYLGKDVTGYFIGNPTFQSLFNTSFILESSHEYFFTEKYFSGLILTHGIHNRESLQDFWTLKVAFDIYTKHKQISQFVNYWFISYGVYPTTGIIMIFTAVAMGYIDIYVTGIDFYKGKDRYAFDYNNAKVLNKIFDNANIRVENPFFNVDEWHDEKMDIEAIELIKNFNNVNLYSITPSSFLSTLVPLAPIQNDTPYIPEEKPEGYLKDIVLTVQQEQEQRKQEQRKQEQEQEQRKQEQEQEQRSIKQQVKNIFIKKDLMGKWDFIRNSWLVQAVYQTIKFPYIILKVIKKLIK
ncbi:MAG: hypothetical protein KFW21_06450 [Spirochaetota bacterium]|nr:hypothetical protein [Spirochaetota bacterium]